MDVESLIQVFHCDQLIIDIHDSYVKQTYRSRCYIAAANGILTLNIPIIHQGKGSSMLYRDVLIDNSQPWASNHLKSIISAYKSSPYFEYFEDDLRQLFKNIPNRLMDWNIITMHWLMDQLYIEKEVSRSSTYQADNKATYLITAKKKSIKRPNPYMQVFQEKHGFLQPASGLDLLFNMGPAARAYLKDERLS